MLIPEMTVGDALVARFRLEPRAAYMHSNDCWLVAFDNKEGVYVKAVGKRSYMRFKNSEDAWKYLRTII